jgi:hypothetical protein
VSTASVIVRTCGCGRSYTADAWLDLTPAGIWDLGGHRWGQRHCLCGSTIAIDEDFDGRPDRMAPPLDLDASERVERTELFIALSRAAHEVVELSLARAARSTELRAQRLAEARERVVIARAALRAFFQRVRASRRATATPEVA